ncbi:MAG TPA: hypothetical protein VFR84_17500 [Candidatus Angelobacter sp.]|nr:hypothetical protein [Candidatus Angelobacter sp.]
MRRCGKAQSRIPRTLLLSAVIVALLAVMTPFFAQGQTKPATKAPQSGAKKTAPAAKKPAPKKADDTEWLEQALKDPELMKAVGHLTDRLTTELQLPASRTQSRILPRLSDSTLFYGAVPNYGPVLRQCLEIWQQELHDSPAIKNFLAKNKLAEGEPKFEEVVQKLIEVADYLGDEMVISVGMKGKEPSGFLVAEARKPGLAAFLQHLDELLNAESKTKEHLRIVDPQQLQTATDDAKEQPIVLVRPDFVLVGLNAATLREANAQLDKGGVSFAASGLGKRLTQSYQSGTSTLFGADLQKLMALIPSDRKGAQMTEMLDKTGFGDAKFAVIESKGHGKSSTTEMELAFNKPRRGIASWIAASAPLGSLDFMSPKSAIVEAFKLKSPAQMFDDIVELAGPAAFRSLPEMEAQFNVNLKQDILNKLGGEIGFELETPPLPPAPGTTAAQPNLKFLLSVTDAAGLQQTIKRLMAESPIQAQERVEGGLTFYSVALPSGQELNYFFQDGYLVLASSRELAHDAVSLHRNGGSVAKAQGQPVKASIFAHQNSNLFFTSMISQLPPESREVVSKMLNQSQPTTNVTTGYADETSIRMTTNSSAGTNASVALIVAAIAIPNLLRSRTAANDAAAASSLRTVNTAQVTYATMYPNKGYAASLAVLGPGPKNDCATPSESHACLLDEKLGAPTCGSGMWCIKNGYKFTVRGVCTAGRCSGYTATATPVNPDSTGSKSFCTTTDAVIRSKPGGVDAPLTMAQCKAWKPI